MRWPARARMAVATVVTAGVAGLAGAEPSTGAGGPYLDQAPPGATARVFAPGLVSGSDFEHSRLEISRDGKAMYWIVQPTRGKQLIWNTRRGPDGRWSKPAALPISDGARELPFLHSPALSPDGRTLYFFSLDLREGQGHAAVTRRTLYALGLQDPRWNAPVPVQAWFPHPDGVWAYSFAANGNLYFDSSFRLRVMNRRGDRYDPPVPLGNPAVDDHEAFAPFVAPDESYVIFSSSENGAVGGSIDLFVTFRRADGGWGPPRNLGPAVNTAANERFASVSPDGKYLFFLRNEPRGDSSFYWIDAAVIEAAR